ncbi:hypothetical protein OK016_22310 [Vibrio chagasii]|nr:hypothetical protein [Vibrio chagasii]
MNHLLYALPLIRFQVNVQYCGSGHLTSPNLIHQLLTPTPGINNLELNVPAPVLMAATISSSSF